MQIRAACQQDCLPLAQFARESFLRAYGGEDPAERVRQHVNENFSDAAIDRDLGNDKVTFLLATENGASGDEHILGYVKLCWQRPIEELDHRPAAQLERIYVDQRRQSGGLGAALITAAAERAGKQGATWLWLGVWQENRRAQRFYEREGFARVGVTHFMMGEVREEDFIYALSLAGKR